MQNANILFRKLLTSLRNDDIILLNLTKRQVEGGVTNV
nr:MAG TPA: hypothetical protein [Caudoviricetes sp.]